MSFLPSLAKGSSSSSNTATQNQNSKIWADKIQAGASSTSSAAAGQEFRSQPVHSQEGNGPEFDAFINSPPAAATLQDLGAVGPYTLLSSGETFSPDIELQQSMDGLDVVNLLDIMDTQQVDLEAMAVGRSGEKREMLDEETEDPVEWLGVSRGEYTDEVWGEGERRGKGKAKGKEEEGSSEKRKGKGKANEVDMKSRL